MHIENMTIGTQNFQIRLVAFVKGKIPTTSPSRIQPSSKDDRSSTLTSTKWSIAVYNSTREQVCILFLKDLINDSNLIY